jgi:hypothetical protein
VHQSLAQAPFTLTTFGQNQTGQVVLDLLVIGEPLAAG